jgi:hypothetical protein
MHDFTCYTPAGPKGRICWLHAGLADAIWNWMPVSKSTFCLNIPVVLTSPPGVFAAWL